MNPGGNGRSVVALNQQIAAKQQSLDDIAKTRPARRPHRPQVHPRRRSPPLAKRYTDELLQQEDTLAILHKNLNALDQQRQAPSSSSEDRRPDPRGIALTKTGTPGGELLPGGCL